MRRVLYNVAAAISLLFLVVVVVLWVRSHNSDEGVSLYFADFDSTPAVWGARHFISEDGVVGYRWIRQTSTDPASIARVKANIASLSVMNFKRQSRTPGSWSSTIVP